MILSNTPVCKFNLTFPNWNTTGIEILTTVATSAPTTLNPTIEADSVKIFNLSPNEVINFVPDVNPTSNIFNFTNQKAILAMNQTTAPKGLPCKAMYPEIDPIIVGHKTQTNVSPTPAKGPIKLVFND